MIKDFCVFIISHGRPDNVHTHRTIRKKGYNGPIFFILDNEDKTYNKYVDNFPEDKVLVFDKKAISKTTDNGDNFKDLRTTTHARNACFEFAKELKYKYFLVLDDDYVDWYYRINQYMEHPSGHYMIKDNLNDVFNNTLEYYKTANFTSICFSQGGDWFGGKTNFNKAPKRKAMNSFFCSTDRPFKFFSRLNEDVNTYMVLGSQGKLFLTIPFIQLNQKQTQATAGGMTETYLQNGTYIKSFYTVMYCPSYVKITYMGRTNKRLHHHISWKNAVPLILDEKHKKQ